MLSITQRFLQGLDDEARCIWLHVHFGLAVLNRQLHGHTDALTCDPSSIGAPSPGLGATFEVKPLNLDFWFCKKTSQPQSPKLFQPQDPSFQTKHSLPQRPSAGALPCLPLAGALHDIIAHLLG